LREICRNKGNLGIQKIEDVTFMTMYDIHPSEWKATAPSIFNMVVAIILVAAGTSAFAGCSFS
jgi:hypothetical protein